MKRLAILLLVPMVLLAIKIPNINIGKVKKTLESVEKASRPINEEEEYYLGRAVAAHILTKYALWKNTSSTQYINSIGQTLRIHSDRPETYGGYHFAILDTLQVNAWSAPGGIVFLTRGLLNLASNEDELAAVLAHEIAHVVNKDPLNSIKTERIKNLGMLTAQEMTGSKEVLRLFNDSIMDISGTLLQKGYSRTQEKNADLMAVRLMAQAGYHPKYLLAMLRKIAGKEGDKKLSVFAAHPAAKKRMSYVGDALERNNPPDSANIRLPRFRTVVNSKAS